MGNGNNRQSGGKSGSTSGGMSKSDSSRIQSLQAKGGNNTGQGSFAARVQSVGDRNGGSKAGGCGGGGVAKK